METKILESSRDDLRYAGKVAREGGLVAFPTETVYGLGADAFNAEAVKAVYAAKGRPSDNPMIVHIADAAELEKLTPQVTEDMKLLAEKLWPGPLTMIAVKNPLIPDATTGGLDTVGIRMPDNEIARDFIRAAGCPIAAPSANISGRPSPTKASHVIDDMNGRIDVILKGGDCRVGIESTVLDMTGEIPMILRPGIITKDMLEDILGKPVEIDPAILKTSMTGDDFIPKAPGMKYKHYAPKADMTIIKGAEAEVRKEIEQLKEKYEAEGKKVGIILFSSDEFEKAAHDFFAELRKMDADGVEYILAGALSDENGIGFAVMNRMLKSAGYHIIAV